VDLLLRNNRRHFERLEELLIEILGDVDAAALGINKGEGTLGSVNPTGTQPVSTTPGARRTLVAEL
jgi:hypothetical protein